MGDYYTGQIHLVKSHYEFTILTILQGEFDQCSSHPFHLYQKIENGKNRYVEAQSAWLVDQFTGAVAEVNWYQGAKVPYCLQYPYRSSTIK